MGTCSFFLEKKKEPKKNRLCLSPVWLTVIRFRIMVFFIREAAYDFLAQRQRHLLCRWRSLVRAPDSDARERQSIYNRERR